MAKARLLIVEDDANVSNMLKVYFSGLNFDVDTARYGSEALEKSRINVPNLVLLDIILPDIDGFDVCRVLRTHTRTSHIPIIFLTQRDQRADKLQGLELGADDYITKPFDIDELRLRVQRAISRAEQQSLIDPRSGLPSGLLIEEQLRRIIRIDLWSYIDIRIQNFDAFRDIYGFVAADNVLRFTAMLLSEAIDTLGSPNDFIGHTGGDNFVLITSEKAANAIQRQICQRFANEVKAHYSYKDRERGYLLAEGSENGDRIGLMTLSVGQVSAADRQFTDIREITELASEVRRQNG